MLKSRYIFACIMFFVAVAASAQSERADIRKGNRLFKDGKYNEAEVEFKRAQQKNATSYEAAYNLGNSLYKQGRNEDALSSYSKLGEDGNNIDNLPAVHYNMGNAYMQNKKYDEAIECYKKALRIDPEDMQAKFNLAYAQKLKKEQDQNNDQNQDNQNQNNNQNQDNQNQNNNQNQDQNKDQNQNNQNQNNNQDQNKDQDNKGQNQPNPNQADNERTLKAIQAAEDKTKDKVDKQQAQAYGKSQGKQW